MIGAWCIGTFLTYYDDDRQTPLHIQLRASSGPWSSGPRPFSTIGWGSTLGDRIATVLFNHDLAVILYFAAWMRDCGRRQSMRRSRRKEALYPRTFRGVVGLFAGTTILMRS